MPKQWEFAVYDASVPARVRVYRSGCFRVTASAVFKAHTELRPAFANLNELIKRLARGETLSVDSFRQEGPGYAFRSGRLRFYGVYSNKFPAAFVLSHAIQKSQQKLAEADVKIMKIVWLHSMTWM